MTSISHAAARRNAFVFPEPARLYMPDRDPTSPAGTALSPGGALVQRRTRRPAATCEIIARLAGFAEVEG